MNNGLIFFAFCFLGLSSIAIIEDCNKTAKYEACIEHHTPKECRDDR